MPKISIGSTKGILIKYFIKVFITSILCVLLFSSLSSIIILKLDFDLSIIQYVSCFICIISSVIISLISITEFKNNLFILSIISVIPLLIYTVVNFCVNGGSSLIIIIKICGILISSFAVSLIKSAKRSRWFYGYKFAWNWGYWILRYWWY
jgi:hypothetical protein